jgi:hypothetical protein
VSSVFGVGGAWGSSSGGDVVLSDEEAIDGVLRGSDGNPLLCVGSDTWRTNLGPVQLYRNKPGFIPAHQNLYKLEK